jgi:predicted amidohydrolase YtcJ
VSAADWLFRGGAVHTGEPGPATVDALAVTGNRIAALGEEAIALRGPRTEVVDLAGGALLPGFQDAHIHAVVGGLQKLGCDLAVVHDLEDYRAAIRAFADDHPRASWIQGSGWYGDVFPGGFPHRDELDRLVPGRPAVFLSHDAHGVWVNTAALRLAGVDRHTPDPPGGRIMRDAGGEATGMLAESAAGLVTRLLPPVTAAQLAEALLQAQAYLHGLGVTAWQDAAVGALLGVPDIFGAYLEAAEAGRLTARVTGALWWDRDQGLGQLESLEERRAAAAAAAGRFRASAVKIMQDGVCENFTAAVVEPYHGHMKGGGEVGGTGESFIDPAELTGIVRQLDARGFDVHMHAVGDRAVRECLDALAACDGGRPRGARHQIAHIDLIQPGDVTRMARLGAIANVQPLWAREDKVLVETKLPYLTAGQKQNHFAFGSLLAAGVPLAMGSDWPVSSPDPLWGIHVAVNRTAPHADPHAQDEHAQTMPLLAGEAVDVRTAVHAYTLGAARANRLDAETGSLAAGKLADLVVLDRDPFAEPATELSSVQVRATFVDGSPVHGAC